MSRPSLPHPPSGTSTTRSLSIAPHPSYTTATTPDSTAHPPLRPPPPAHRPSHQPLLSPPSPLASTLPASTPPAAGGSAPVKATRFDRSGLHGHWTRFKRTTGFGPPGPFTTTGTGSSSVDESGAGADVDESRFHRSRREVHPGGSGGVRWGRVVARTITSDGSTSRRFWGKGAKKGSEDVEMGQSAAGDHTVHWASVRRHQDREIGGGDEQDDEMDDAEVDAVVVDNQFLSLDKSTQRSQSTHPHHIEDSGTPPTGPTGSASSGVAESRAMVLLRYRIWPVIERFFSLHFHDPVSETQYRKETFYTHKTLAFWAGCFLILNWVLAAALTTKPYSRQDLVFVYGVAPFLTVPIPVFIVFDWPRTRPWIYQVWLACAIWSWGFYNVMFMFLCGAYGQPVHFSCANRDYLVLFYYCTGLPVIAMFAMQQNRTVQTIMVVAFICTAGALLLPWRRGWIKHVLNLIIYHSFVLYINWMRETAERRLYVLRDQLKTQYKQTQKAQISERKSSDSKRRLTSYIFHEVRVPLNTALLAAQNLAGTNAIQREHEIEFNALEGSLNMMSKVLNDVLDFNRMDSGRFETVSKPFAFHAVIRSMLVPLGLGASAKGLQLIVELDEQVDVQARLAAYRAQALEMDFGFSNDDSDDHDHDHKREFIPKRHDEFQPKRHDYARGYDSQTSRDYYDSKRNVRDYEARRRADEWVAQRMADGSDEDGIVMGDEMRLRQIVTNLASNACKFTEAGGNITLRTKLIIPGPEHPRRVSLDRGKGEPEPEGKDRPSESSGRPSTGEFVSAPPFSRTFSGDSADDGGPGRSLEHIVVRIEVEDTGVGIGQRDMEEKRLFSAFMQTSSGLRQGGKGTGLGLALVRHIVALSGGRLGVKSKRAVGSTFWIELPLGVGRKAVAGVQSGRTRDAKVDAINFSGGGWAGTEEVRPGPTPLATDPGVGAGMAVYPSMNAEVGSAEPARALGDVLSSTGEMSDLSSGALLNAAGPGVPLQGTSALRSIMEHGGVVELVPQLPMIASAEDGPIVATRTLSPDSTRQSAGGSPVNSRLGMSDPSASRMAMSDPSASRVGLSDPSSARVTSEQTITQVPVDPITARIAMDSSVPRMVDQSVSRIAADPSAMRIVMPDPSRAGMGVGVLDSQVRVSPKPSAHRSMPSESSLPMLKSSPSAAGEPTAASPEPGAGNRPTGSTGNGTTTGSIGPAGGSMIKGVGSGESLAALRVLVVDDDSLTRRLMTRMLTRLGCTVDNAENGQVALDMLLAPLPTPQSQKTQSSAGFPSFEPGTIAPSMSALDALGDYKYDIIFLDNHMPICSGVEVAKRLRKLDRRDFVVGVTGNALTEDQQEYLQAGANYVLTKPVLEKSLKAMLVLADERRKSPEFSN